jgi:hypothetical protein
LQGHHPVRSQQVGQSADDGDRIRQELQNKAADDRIERLGIPEGGDVGAMKAYIGKPRGAVARSRAVSREA